MLAILLIWVYIFLISLVFGCATVKLLTVLLKEDGAERLPLSLLVFLGLGSVTTILGYLSLFAKIAGGANVLILLGALLLTGVYHRELASFLKSGLRRLWAMDKCILGLLLLSSLFILLKSTAPPSSYDTGLYHAQAIRWIEEYPVIPGLGNLHGRLAFNSAWFLPNALFGFAFLKHGPFHVLNGFILLIVVIMSLEGLSNLIKGQYQGSNILRGGLALPAIFIFKDHLSSPTPDIPVALLTCAVFIYYLQLQENAAEVPRGLVSLGIVILTTLAIVIKYSSLPLAIFIVVLAGQEIARGRPVNLWLITGAVLVLVLPIFLRNIWLSGYLLYPLPGLDLFNFDWKIPGAAALAEKTAIVYFARDPGNLAPPGAVKTLFDWLPYWLPQVLTGYGSKLEKIFLPSLILFLDWLGHMVKMRTCKIDLREISKNKVIYLTVAGGLAFWFFTAPDPRFALGLLMVAAVIIFIPFLQTYDYHVSRLVPWSLALLIIYFLAAFGAGDLPALTSRVWRPAPYPQVPLAVEEIQGKVVYFTQGREQKCWYGPLPCTYYNSSKIAFRGERIEDGFKPLLKP
jgi:hypothetical protein